MATSGGLVGGAIVMSFLHGGLIELGEFVVRRAFHIEKPIVRVRVLRSIGRGSSIMLFLTGLYFLVVPEDIGHKAVGILLGSLVISASLALGVVIRSGEEEVEADKIMTSASKMRARGKHAEAICLCEQVVSRFPTSEARMRAEKLLNDLQHEKSRPSG